MATVHSSPFSIKTEAFEGPLELLLELVERRKLLINDISLAEVTDEYMRQVSLMQEHSLPNTAQFIQLAATLLLIKSKSLLPVLELTEDEEQGIGDLEHRLKLYQIYRDAGQQLQTQFGQNILHSKQFAPASQPLFVTDSFTTTDSLTTAMREVLHNLPQKRTKPHVQVKPTITLEAMLERLHTRIAKEMKFQFSDLIDDPTERVNVIVGFLAVLESVKQGSILVAQVERFADFDIEKETVTIPRYY